MVDSLNKGACVIVIWEAKTPEGFVVNNKARPGFPPALASVRAKSLPLFIDSGDTRRGRGVSWQRQSFVHHSTNICMHFSHYRGYF